MNGTRRRFFQDAAVLGAGLFASAKVLSAQKMQMSGDMPGMNMKGKKGSIHDHGSPVLVETPDVPNLPWRMDGNVKEFHLIAEPVQQTLRLSCGTGSASASASSIWGWTTIRSTFTAISS